MVLQVEYYFSDENLPNDKYMLSLIKKNKEGFGEYLVYMFVSIELSCDLFCSTVTCFVLHINL